MPGQLLYKVLPIAFYDTVHYLLSLRLLMLGALGFFIRHFKLEKYLQNCTVAHSTFIILQPMTMVQNFQCLLLKCVHIFRFLLEHIFTIFISECVSICKQAHFDFVFFSKYSDSNEVKGTDSSCYWAVCRKHWYVGMTMIIWQHWQELMGHRRPLRAELVDGLFYLTEYL